MSGAIALVGTLTPVANFKASTIAKLSIAGFPAEKAGFTLVIVMRDQSEKINSPRASDHGIRGVVGKMLVAQQSVRDIRQMPADVGVGREQRRSKSTERDEPCRIGETNPRRTRPHVRSDRGQTPAEGSTTLFSVSLG